MLAPAVGLTPPVVMSLADGGPSFRTWCRLRGESLGGPQASAAGAWIGLDLGRRRHDRLGGQEAEAGVAAAIAHRQFRRADAAAAFRGKEALDDPVLERV